MPIWILQIAREIRACKKLSRNRKRENKTFQPSKIPVTAVKTRAYTTIQLHISPLQFTVVNPNHALLTKFSNDHPRYSPQRNVSVPFGQKNSPHNAPVTLLTMVRFPPGQGSGEKKMENEPHNALPNCTTNRGTFTCKKQVNNTQGHILSSITFLRVFFFKNKKKPLVQSSRETMRSNETDSQTNPPVFVFGHDQ
jgi:hypothetical protein